MRRTVWVIWLCLALLPLRGMAHAVMLGAGASHGAAAVLPVAQTSAPCPMHVAMSVDDGASPTEVAAPVPAIAFAGTCCHLCAVCHGAVMSAPTVATVAVDPPHDAPQERAGPGNGRVAPDGLFRPPR